MDPAAETHQVGVIGLGYVGLPLALAFAQAGSTVVGLDSDSRRSEAVNAGTSHVEDVSPEEMKKRMDAWASQQGG